MKKKISILLTVAVIVFGCSTPAYVEKDTNVNLSDYKTYMWVDTRATQDDASARATAFADIGVHNAVNAELQRWGWSEVTDNPDVLVGYDVLVERNVDVQTEPVYSQPFTRFYYNPYMRRWSTIYYPSQFLGYQEYRVPVREATLTISIMDADTDKKVWQGWTTERLSGNSLGDLDVRRGVKNIFKEAGEAAP